MASEGSYGQILKSSFVMGGAAGIVFLLGMIRTKFAALIVGTTGLGLIASFSAIQVFIGSIAGIGLQSSAVRQIAIAVSQGDDESVGRIVLALRRLCWLTGLVGMACTILLSPHLSRITFGNEEYVLEVAGIGVIILLVNLTGGQLALLQGMRRIGDMAWANISGAILGTLTAVSFYHWLGMRGIVPSFVASAAVQLSLVWFFARRVQVLSVTLTWRQTLHEANGLVKLGFVFMWNGLMVSAVSYFTIVLIRSEIDLHAAGLYSAAFLLSGVPVNLVLGAMGMDYYPRLTMVAHDKTMVKRLVNEQTEIGILIAAPAVLATIVFAPMLIQIFYTQDFAASVELLQWFVLGTVLRAISWPLGYVILALGKGNLYLITETTINILHILLIAGGIEIFGIKGVAIAFFVLNIIYIGFVYLVGSKIVDFNWTARCRRIIFFTMLISIIVFALVRIFEGMITTAIGLGMTIFVSFICLRELADRIGSEHRIIRFALMVPGLKYIINSTKK